MLREAEAKLIAGSGKEKFELGTSSRIDSSGVEPADRIDDPVDGGWTISSGVTPAARMEYT